MTILFKDTFTDTTGTLLTAHTLDTSNNGNKWIIPTGVTYGASISNNTAIPFNTSGQNIISNIVTGVSDNFAISVDITNNQATTWIEFRSTGEANRFWLQLNTTKSSGNFALRYNQTDNQTEITNTQVTYVAGATMKVEVTGLTVKAYYNNVLQFTATITNLNQTSTQHGIGFFNATAATGTYFDNFQITDLATGGTTTYVGSGTTAANATLNQPDKKIALGNGPILSTPLASAVEHIFMSMAGTVQGTSILSSGESIIVHSGSTYSGSGNTLSASIVNTNEMVKYLNSGNINGLASLSDQSFVSMAVSSLLQVFSNLNTSEVYKPFGSADTYPDSGISTGYVLIITNETLDHHIPHVLITQLSLKGSQGQNVYLVGKKGSTIQLNGHASSTIQLKGGKL